MLEDKYLARLKSKGFIDPARLPPSLIFPALSAFPPLLGVALTRAENRLCSDLADGDFGAEGSRLILPAAFTKEGSVTRWSGKTVSSPCL